MSSFYELLKNIHIKQSAGIFRAERKPLSSFHKSILEAGVGMGETAAVLCLYKVSLSSLLEEWKEKVSSHNVRRKSGTDLGLSGARAPDITSRVWALGGQAVLTGCEFF